MSASIEKAIQLYNEGKYLEAMDMGSELMKNKDLRKDVWLLSAKCLMVNVPTTESNDVLEEVADSLIKAVEEAKSVKEAFDILLDFKSAFSIWDKKMTAQAYAKFEANPCENEFNNCTHVFVPIFKADMAVTLPAKQCDAMKVLLEAEGLTLKEAVAKYENKQPYENHFTEADRDELEFVTANRVVTRAREKFELNKKVSSANYKSVQLPIATAVIYALYIYNATYDKKRDGIPDEVRFERLKAYVSWKSFLLEAMFIVDGNKVAMYCPNDDSDLNDIKKAYAKMKELKPDFEIPALPVPAKNLQKSGGCYVATAVYGSYDCPQVWTLRRYRDDILAQSWYGRAFIRTYYTISPTLVKWFGHTEWFKNMWQSKLDRMVSRLQESGIESTPYEDKNW